MYRNTPKTDDHSTPRLLGVRKDSEKILSAAAKKGELPLLAQLSQAQDLSPLGQRMLRHDMLASNLYASVVTDKFKTAFCNEIQPAGHKSIGSANKGTAQTRRKHSRSHAVSICIFPPASDASRRVCFTFFLCSALYTSSYRLPP